MICFTDLFYFDSHSFASSPKKYKKNGKDDYVY